ncbi:LemA family protein [Thiomicrorhabdus sediminis]|uniref:LemA family protein n=1 Tax=Thiomicrorhabdus sediminis TaxID=2580412 RepID=A0A4P9K461_9GAMM|nr:LemA family protein [Thiomicrorhabdus sediminis]QCU89695.1 LemA family protein [Thiomicrorhabdus sediminis]
MDISPTMITVFIIVLLIISVITIYNQIVSLKESVKRGWANVITQERQKGKILPELLKLVDQYTGYEGEVLTAVTELRGQASKLQNDSQQLRGDSIDVNSAKQFDDNVKAFLGGLNFVAEAYPDLKANDTFKKAMHEVTKQEENVGAAIRIFNSNVEEFNAFIGMFPMNLVNGFLNKEQALNIFEDSTAASAFEYKPNFK